MKTFLRLTIFAMLSAGAYGLLDMLRDVHTGTMINYDLAEKKIVRMLQQDHGNGKAIFTAQQFHVNVPVKKNDAVAKNDSATAHHRHATLDFSSGDFSRSMPVPDFNSTVQLDSTVLQSADTGKSTAVQPSRFIPQLEVTHDSLSTVPVRVATPHFSALNLFSRGAPMVLNLAPDSTIAHAADSLKIAMKPPK